MLKEVLDFYHSPVVVWIFLEFFLMLILIFVLKFKNGGSYIFFELVYEKVYCFFGDIIGSWKEFIKTYVAILFFIILLSNLIGIFLELLSPIFWIDKSQNFLFENYIIIPSADINFNLALAIISVFIILYVQFQELWFKSFLYDYFPIFWKNYISIEKWSKNGFIFCILKVCVKIFDIIISMFLWVLEIIWLFAKIISLSFRLFGNITSGTILLGITVFWVGSITKNSIWFEFPIILPVLIYLQEILVAFIQATIFPLLVAIFIRMSVVKN